MKMGQNFHVCLRSGLCEKDKYQEWVYDTVVDGQPSISIASIADSGYPSYQGLGPVCLGNV